MSDAHHSTLYRSLANMSEIQSAPIVGGQGAAWWFRITLDSAEQFELLRAVDRSVFNEFVCQLENADDHLHAQGMIRLFNRARLTTIIKSFTDLGFSKEFVQVGRLVTVKDVSAMRNYCMKEETRVNGVDPIHIGLSDSTASEKVTPHMQVLSLLREHGEFEAQKIFITLGHKVKVWRDAKESYDMEQRVMTLEKMSNQFESTVLRPWQQDLWKLLEEEPKEREIVCIVDKIGNTGKTFFARYLKAKNPDQVVLLNNGKAGDLSHIMNDAKNANTIVMQLQRSVEAIVNYQALEQFKDNVYCSTKYQSSSNVGMHNHLCVMTNFPLDWSKLSEDRWTIWRLDSTGGYKTYTATSYRMAFPDDVPIEASVSIKRKHQDPVDEAPEPKMPRQPMSNADMFKAMHARSASCPLECYDRCCNWRENCSDKGRGPSCFPFSPFRCTCQNK